MSYLSLTDADVICPGKLTRMSYRGRPSGAPAHVPRAPRRHVRPAPYPPPPAARRRPPPARRPPPPAAARRRPPPAAARRRPPAAAARRPPQPDETRHWPPLPAATARGRAALSLRAPPPRAPPPRPTAGAGPTAAAPAHRPPDLSRSHRIASRPGATAASRSSATWMTRRRFSWQKPSHPGAVAWRGSLFYAASFSTQRRVLPGDVTGIPGAGRRMAVLLIPITRPAGPRRLLRCVVPTPGIAPDPVPADRVPAPVLAPGARPPSAGPAHRRPPLIPLRAVTPIGRAGGRASGVA